MWSKDNNNDTVYWDNKLNQSEGGYRKLRETVEKKKPGRKLKIVDLTSSTTASETECSKDDEVIIVTEKVFKKLGRPRKVNFDNGNGNVIEIE